MFFPIVEKTQAVWYSSPNEVHMHIQLLTNNPSLIQDVRARNIGPFHTLVEVEFSGKMYETSWGLGNNDNDITLSTTLNGENIVLVLTPNREIVSITLSEMRGYHIRFLIEFTDGINDFDPQAWEVPDMVEDEF